MSTGCNCEFIEVKPGVWFYILEHYNAPKNAWDWRENADAHGPFSSDDAAIKHLSDNHANPGGYCVNKYREGFGLDETLKQLIGDAVNRKPIKSQSNWLTRSSVRFHR